MAMIPALLWAVAALLQGEQLAVKSYTTEDGLPHNHINCIRQDSRGFLWFGTDEGLSRFDGYAFTNYSTRHGLPHPWVNDVLIAGDGAYWVATDGGVCRYNPTGKPAFTVYRPSQREGAQRVNALVEDRSGIIWCATYDGLYRMVRARGVVWFEPVGIGSPGGMHEGSLVNSIHIDKAGVMWAASRSGLYRRDLNGRWQRFHRDNGLSDNFVGAALRDRAGRLWITTRTGGLCKIVPEPDASRNAVERCYSRADGLPDNDVRAIFETGDGTLWLGTPGGLTEFKPESPGKPAQFRTYDAKNGLAGAVVYEIFEDGDRNLWLGTKEAGVIRVTRGGFTTYDDRDGFRQGSSPASIFETSQGEICLTTIANSHRWIQFIAGSHVRAFEPNVPNRFEMGWQDLTIRDRAGEWWMATHDGLFRFAKVNRAEELATARAKVVYAFGNGLPGNGVNRIYQDRAGDIWIASDGTEGLRDVIRWERSTGRLRSLLAETGDSRLAERTASAFCEDGSGGLWIGFHHGGGVARLRAGSLTWPVGPDAGWVDSCHADHANRVWIASSGKGLIRIDDPSALHPSTVAYTTAEGLSSNEVRSITEDQWGRIYAGTGRGVDVVDPEYGVVKRYNSADGLTKGAIKAAYRDHSGALWFASGRGISRLAPTANSYSRPRTVITGLRIRGTTRPISDLGEARIEGLVLQAGESQVEIDFTGFDYSPGAKLRYQFKLEGVDRDWSIPSERRSVHFASLSPGGYRFLARAVSAGSEPSPEAEVRFTVLAPYYRQWWFLLTAAAAGAALVYWLFRYRMRQALAMERLRMRIATDLHDEIGASLSQIAILSEVARLGNGEDGRSAAALSRISGVAREMVDSVSDIVWTIHPQRDRLEDLTQRLREIAGELLLPHGIELSVRSPPETRDVRLGLDARRQLLSIFKESLHNIVRHSGCERVRIELALSGTRLELVINDNGRGFNLEPARNSARGRGHGLAGMRWRARNLGGDLEVLSSEGSGCTVIARIPAAATYTNK